MDLIVISGLLISSIRYRIRSLGSAINTSVIAGRIVHTSSIVCPSSKYRLISLFVSKEDIMYPTRIVIIIKIINVWSWKKINCSINGELASWVPKFDQVAILNERITLYE